ARVPSSPHFHGQSSLDETLATVEAALQAGAIAAIKASWGFDLVCDATNGEAVRRLRTAKGTVLPLALMVRNGAIARQYASVGDLEAQALQQPGAPIVILNAQPQSSAPSQQESQTSPLAPGIRPPGSITAVQNTLGIMLPPNTLYQRLLERLDHPLMVTSGNLAGGVPGVDNHQVRLQLEAIADYFLMNNQPVTHSVEASVVQVLSFPAESEAKSLHQASHQVPRQDLEAPASAQQLQVIRRSRGQASTLIRLPRGFETAPPILAMGPTFDNTIALLRRNHAVLSRHLGHLDTASGLQAYQAALNHHRHLWNFDPKLVAVEAHPDYHPTKLGREWHQDAHPTVAVQHHHAHLAACLIDNQIPLTTAPVLALVLDDFGYGDDGTLWGGELLWGSYQSLVRLGSLRPVPLPANRLKRRHPWPWALTQTLTQSRPHTSSIGWLLGEVAVTMGLVRDTDSHGLLLLEGLAHQELSKRPAALSDLSPQ
ncbi:MAG: Sua5/YciO/YrdC/YwlC family protein, partial [Cyanobacteria bacterium P01_H01_bin.130]